MKKLKKKNIFDFGSSEHKLACLYLRKTFSNIFVTLTDLRHRLLFVKLLEVLALLVRNVENVFHML